MNNKQAYEITITSKLEALPLPDMEDAIWSRIEAQLDIDLPTDDGGGGTSAPKSPINFGWFGGAGLFCITAVLISLFTLTQSKDRERSESTTSEEIKTGRVDSTSADASPPTTPPRKPPNTVSSNTTSNDANNAIVPLDSNATTNLPLPSLTRDSSQVQLPPPVAIVPQKDTTPPKRSRGVKGISDSDYRIVPKKDTSR